MIVVTEQMLAEFTYFSIQLEDVPSNISSEEEKSMASNIVSGMQDMLNENGLSTQVEWDWAQCGNAVHPLIRLNSLKDYGSIGLISIR